MCNPYALLSEDRFSPYRHLEEMAPGRETLRNLLTPVKVDLLWRAFLNVDAHRDAAQHAMVCECAVNLRPVEGV
jgi:hypothetical protein